MVRSSRVTRGSDRGHEYSKAPVCITWHHTTVDIPWVNIVNFELYKYDSTPGNNVNIGRDGRVALLAAGATATNGSGTEMQFSRGMGGRNSTTFTMEIHNDGRGQAYPRAQIDAAFAVSNAINKICGNQPTDLCTHHEYAPGRKTDPSRYDAVQGSWHPRSCTSAGTWHHDDIRAEAVRRWSGAPPPTQGDDVHPTVSSRGNGRLDMFATGSDGQLWHRWYDGNYENAAWTEWEGLGGQLVGPPTATSWGSDRIDIFGVGTDGNIWQIAWADDAWTPWQSLGDNP